MQNIIYDIIVPSIFISPIVIHQIGIQKHKSNTLNGFSCLKSYGIKRDIHIIPMEFIMIDRKASADFPGNYSVTLSFVYYPKT